MSTDANFENAITSTDMTTVYSVNGHHNRDAIFQQFGQIYDLQFNQANILMAT
jgi:hypothetical protein